MKVDKATEVTFFLLKGLKKVVRSIITGADYPAITALLRVAMLVHCKHPPTSVTSHHK